MTRLARLVDDSDPAETVLVLGGEHGVVTLHVSLCGVPQAMVLHSPREVPGWVQTVRCCRMEMQCWCLTSVTEDELAGNLGGALLPVDEPYLWGQMEDCYRLYLERA